MKKNQWVFLPMMLSALACLSVSCKGGAAESQDKAVADSCNVITEESMEEPVEVATPTVVNGALVKAAYKVSPTKSVYFSQGNLQFNAMQGTHATADGEAKGTWRFAEKQYDCVGEDNNKISETYDGWIDLFGWGTSGWSGGAKVYQPWSYSEHLVSVVESDYYIGGSESNSLTGDYAKADWGVYNAISNGGNTPNMWRTLTLEEWQYLFQNNNWTLGYVKTSAEDSITCFMLIPAGFTAPEGLSVSVIGTGTTEAPLPNLEVPSSCREDLKVSPGNTYTPEQFKALEDLGVVALPGADSRGGILGELDDLGDGRYVNFNGHTGDYWLATAHVTPYGSSYAASYFRFNADCFSAFADASSEGNEKQCLGKSVRLVQDVK